MLLQTQQDRVQKVSGHCVSIFNRFHSRPNVSANRSKPAVGKLQNLRIQQKSWCHWGKIRTACDVAGLPRWRNGNRAQPFRNRVDRFGNGFVDFVQMQMNRSKARSRHVPVKLLDDQLQRQ